MRLGDNNNNNNRFIISTIGPTRQSLLVTKDFLIPYSAFYALCSINLAYLEMLSCFHVMNVFLHWK